MVITQSLNHKPLTIMTFLPKTHVYSLSGQFGRIISTHPDGGYLVEPAYDCESEVRFLGIERWLEAFEKAPTERLNIKVVELQNEIAELQETRSQLIRTKMMAEKDLNDRIIKLKAHSDALAHIDDYLEGRITHFVIGSSWKFQRLGKLNVCDLTDPKGEAFYERNERRLLCLYGKKNMDLEWRLHAYSDGSGGSYTLAFPCLSLEAAQTKLKELVQGQLDKWIANAINADAADTILVNCRTAGIKPPQQLVDAHESTLLRNAQAAVDEFTRKLASAKNVLDNLSHSPVGA